MKIGIDIRSTLKKQKTGIGYYTLNLINNLARADSKASYFLYSRIRPFDMKRRLLPLPGRNFSHRVDRLNFRPEISMGDMDVFHTSSYDIKHFKKTKLVTTMHDIIPLVFPEGYPEEVLEKLKKDIKRVFDESSLIIASSLNTKKDLEDQFSFDSEKIKVIYPGRDESLSPVDDKVEIERHLKGKYGIDKKFILFVGTVEKRKNVKALIQAFFELKNEKKIPHHLVIIGMKGWGGEAAFDLVNQSGLKEEVRLIGYIPRKDLALFYNTADLFVYPSLYEGFGFPILEAFSCGVPVITSATTSCGEVAGDAAVTINPADTNALKSAINRVLLDEGLKKEMRERGFKRARLFSWKETAEQFQKIFYDIIT